ncbi:hypothetical protein LTR66_003688 [Elasticomyces elasticus]|nr:hypothetical protein LTR66_003688 [Elasticomyces elasticus]
MTNYVGAIRMLKLNEQHDDLNQPCLHNVFYHGGHNDSNDLYGLAKILFGAANKLYANQCG